MTMALLVEGHGRSWRVGTSEELRAALSFRDSRGGGLFWISSLHRQFPCIAIRASGPHFDLIYFVDKDHAGDWCFRPASEGPTASVPFQYEGCDPFDGEDVEGRFIISFDLALAIAEHFRTTGTRDESVQWFDI